MQGTDGLPRESVEPGDVLASAAQKNRLADVLEFDALLEPLGSQPAIRGRLFGLTVKDVARELCRLLIVL